MTLSLLGRPHSQDCDAPGTDQIIQISRPVQTQPEVQEIPPRESDFPANTVGKTVPTVQTAGGILLPRLKPPTVPSDYAPGIQG